jgi:hypothetical protein
LRRGSHSAQHPTPGASDPSPKRVNEPPLGEPNYSESPAALRAVPRSL